jgi:hypothetical protein
MTHKRIIYKNTDALVTLSDGGNWYEQIGKKMIQVDYKYKIPRI